MFRLIFLLQNVFKIFVFILILFFFCFKKYNYPTNRSNSLSKEIKKYLGIFIELYLWDTVKIIKKQKFNLDPTNGLSLSVFPNLCQKYVNFSILVCRSCFLRYPRDFLSNFKLDCQEFDLLFEKSKFFEKLFLIYLLFVHLFLRLEPFVDIFWVKVK